MTSVYDERGPEFSRFLWHNAKEPLNKSRLSAQHKHWI